MSTLNTCGMRYFLSIEEMPLYNWTKCQRGDLTYTRKAVDDAMCNDELDLKTWEIVNDDYLQRFGLTKQHKRFMILSKQKALLELDLFITGDNFLKNRIDELADELKNVFADNKGGIDVDSTLIYLSKFMGYKIRSKDITVLEYFKMIELYGKEN